MMSPSAFDTMNAAHAEATADGRVRRRLLEELDLLDTPHDAVLQSLVTCAADITGCPIALVSLLDAERQWFKSAVGLDILSSPLEQAFCRYTIGGDALYEVPDAQADPRFSTNPLVTGEPGIRYYAGVPVGTGSHRLGALCVIDRQPRRLSKLQRLALEGLASTVTCWIDARQHQLALLRSESRLNDFARVESDWLWECDAGSRLVYCNDGFGDLWSGDADSGAGAALQDAPVLQEQGEPQLPPLLLSELLQRRAAFSGRCIARLRAGRELYIAMSAVAIESRTGAFMGWRGVARDTTLEVAERRAARAREAAATDAHRRELAATQAALDKSVFFSRLSHELRTPLNAVSGFAQLLLMDSAQPLTAGQRLRVAHIKRAGNLLLDLLNDVLDISRFEHKGRVLDLEPMPLGEVVADCVAMLEPLARLAGVHIEVDAGIDRLRVQADRRALTQVLMNLLNNGIKYNRQDGLLRIFAETHGRSVCVIVSDQGAGIPLERRHELFEPFNRLGAEKSQVEGTGLGLVIARQLSQAMGGGLEIGDTSEAGSSFRLQLLCPSEQDAKDI